MRRRRRRRRRMLGSTLRRMLKLYQYLGLTSYLLIYSMLFLFVIHKNQT